MRHVSRRAALGLASLAAGLRPAAGQTLPRPARTIVGFPAGGSSDVVARLYAEKLRGLYAPSILVENRTGAAGRIAVEAVKAAAPDGETWLQTPASMLTLQPWVFPKQVRYDALVDLIPVSTVVAFPFALAVPTAHPAKDLPGFAAWAKAQGADIPYASPAAGAAPHFMGVMLAKAIGARMTHVSYRGAAPAIQDLIGGRIQAYVGVLGDCTPFLNQGLRILAVSTDKRLPRYPDIPTFAELGFAQLTRDEWFGALLPAATPTPLVQGLFEAITRVASTSGMRETLEKQDYLVVTSPSPGAFAERIRRERAGWQAIVRESGITLDD